MPGLIVLHLGEVFILEDGGEVDLDLGNYERFLDVRLTKDNNITTGKIYQQVIEREVPHIYVLFVSHLIFLEKRGLFGKDGPSCPTCDRCHSGLD